LTLVLKKPDPQNLTAALDLRAKSAKAWPERPENSTVKVSRRLREGQNNQSRVATLCSKVAKLAVKQS